jgi:hypothetical protein
MNISKIEENLEALTKSLNPESFIYDLLLAYGKPKSSITRLKAGTYNLAKQKEDGDVLWKKVVFFKAMAGESLHSGIDDLQQEPGITKQAPRFIVVTDFKSLLAVDTKTRENRDIPIGELHKHADFFMPWTGKEKAQTQLENPADVKAAGRMAQLYDEICQDNPHTDLSDEALVKAELHARNVFLCRLLFCFFAEDSEIFKEVGCFTNAIKSHTQDDGSDLSEYLERLFEVLSLKEEDSKRKQYPHFLQAFPYVNGGLFKDKFQAPRFTRKSRDLLIKSGELDWSAINPDIFGSMMQGVVHTSQRASLGMHYTSVPNIMKVMKPLFLDDLHEELEKAQDDPKKLKKLHERLSKIKIFDPACGSGNFLIIAYKELRRLEIKIFQALQPLGQQLKIPLSTIALTQFYGIEIDDFAHEVAILSLWLTEHQMNVEFKDAFGSTRPSLPLRDGGQIACGNATRLDWETVCPKVDDDEIYLLGNPPYLGSFLQNKEQKEDLAFVCKGFKSYKDLDYICCWFLRGANYIEKSNAELAFVTTNSISQGEQVPLLWPHIFEKNLEIGFVYQSFKWKNNATGNAGVTCVIINLRKPSNKAKFIYTGQSILTANNISPYLFSGKNSIVQKKIGTPISNLPQMYYGNKVVDNGSLLLSRFEKEQLITEYPQSEKYIRKFMGSAEFIKGNERWCLWVKDAEFQEASTIPVIRERFENVAKFRASSTEKSTREMAKYPYRFYFIAHQETGALIIPSVSSERREYIPIGFVNANIIISNLAYVIYNPTPFIFGIISSTMHMAWVKAVSGRLKTDYRYSSSLCYNNFPFPDISPKQKETLTTHVFNVLSEREKHPEKTMAELYDPDKMPSGLREAHHYLDIAVEQCYRSKPFTSDEERLEYLFKLYEEMTQAEQKGLTHA